MRGLSPGYDSLSGKNGTSPEKWKAYLTWYRKCAKLKTESKLSIRQKRMGRMKGGIALENRLEALRKAGRMDLIGYGPKCLVRPKKDAGVRTGKGAGSRHRK